MPNYITLPKASTPFNKRNKEVTNGGSVIPDPVYVAFHYGRIYQSIDFI